MFNIKVWFKKRKVKTRRLLIDKADVVEVVDKLSDIGKENSYYVGRCDDGKYYFAFEATNGEWETFVNSIGRTMVLKLVCYEYWFELV